VAIQRDDRPRNKLQNEPCAWTSSIHTSASSTWSVVQRFVGGQIIYRRTNLGRRSESRSTTYPEIETWSRRYQALRIRDNRPPIHRPIQKRSLHESERTAPSQWQPLVQRSRQTAFIIGAHRRHMTNPRREQHWRILRIRGHHKHDSRRRGQDERSRRQIESHAMRHAKPIQTNRLHRRSITRYLRGQSRIDDASGNALRKTSQ